MTYETYKSIWAAEITEARFDLINVRMGGLLNLVVFGDASTDTTDATVLPFFIEFSEELLLTLVNAAKANKFSDVWQFIGSRVMDFFIDKYNKNLQLFDLIQKILGQTESIELTDLTGFGSSGDI